MLQGFNAGTVRFMLVTGEGYNYKITIDRFSYLVKLCNILKHALRFKQIVKLLRVCFHHPEVGITFCYGRSVN